MTWADDTIRVLTVFWQQNASLLLYLLANAGRLQCSAQTRKICMPCCFGEKLAEMTNLANVHALQMCYF